MHQPATVDWSRLLADRSAHMRASEIRELLKLLDQPDIISFAGGIPDPALFPAEAARQASESILGDPAMAAHALQYAASEGHLPLRRWIAGYMARQGVACDADNIVLTSGSQQALDLLGRLMIDAGTTVAVTAPTYLGALQAFNSYQPHYVRLDPSAPASVEAGTRLAYVVADFANPTGRSLDLVARRGLVELARHRRMPLIEDAAYRDLRFDGEPLPSCLALDIDACGDIEHSLVAYCGTFSKSLSPGLRVGWICAARQLVQKVVLAKQAGDLHSPPLTQMIAHRLAETCFDAQVRLNCETYGRRRDAMLQALGRHMPPGVAWQEPEGGMFVWLELPAACDGGDLLQQALAEARIAFVPGRAFFADGSGHNTIRLNFSMNPPERIEQGVARLGRLVERHAAVTAA